MRVIEDTITILSHRRYRIVFLLLLVLLAFGMGYSLRDTSLEDLLTFKITDIKDILELFLILVTLALLWFKTNKSEISRYKNNYNFYKKTYSKLNLLQYQKDHTTIATSSSVKFSIDNEKFTHLTLDNIFFKLENCEYSLPFLIEEQARDILIQKFNIQEKTDYNGRTLSLKNINFISKSQTEIQLELSFCRAYYFQALLTNLIPEYEIIHNVTVRDIIESPNTRTLNSLDDSLAVNHLGISSLISISINERKFFIIPKRSENTAVFKGALSPSLSGAANIHSCRQDNGELKIKKFFENEYNEEIQPFLEKLFGKDAAKKELEYFLLNVKLVGISRELKRLGKPEMFFYYSSTLSTNTENILNNKLISVLKNEVDYFQLSIIENKKTLIKDIDNSENSSFFLISVDTIHTLLKEKHTPSKSKSSYNGEEINVHFLPQDTLVLSESLLVNLIFSETKR